MTGNNTIILCPAEMHAALTYYFNHCVFTPAHGVEVARVVETKECGTSTFEITLAAPEAEAVAIPPHPYKKL